MSKDMSRIYQVRKLAGLGLTAAQIAESIGGTRNAVIGLCWREGIKLSHPSGSAKTHTSPERLAAIKQWLVDRPFAMQTEVAKEFGMSKVTANKIARLLREGWPK